MRFAQFENFHQLRGHGPFTLLGAACCKSDDLTPSAWIQLTYHLLDACQAHLLNTRGLPADPVARFAAPRLRIAICR